MRLKVSCPKRVIKEQIEKYEKVLGDEEYLINWIKYQFGSAHHCPVCHYREMCHTPLDREPCPAIVNGNTCTNQMWYKELWENHLHGGNVTRIKEIVKARLQYWKEVYDAR